MVGSRTKGIPSCGWRREGRGREREEGRERKGEGEGEGRRRERERKEEKKGEGEGEGKRKEEGEGKEGVIINYTILSVSRKPLLSNQKKKSYQVCELSPLHCLWDI